MHAQHPGFHAEGWSSCGLENVSFKSLEMSVFSGLELCSLTNEWNSMDVVSEVLSVFSCCKKIPVMKNSQAWRFKRMVVVS